MFYKPCLKSLVISVLNKAQQLNDTVHQTRQNCIVSISLAIKGMQCQLQASLMCAGSSVSLLRDWGKMSPHMQMASFTNPFCIDLTFARKQPNQLFQTNTHTKKNADGINFNFVVNETYSALKKSPHVGCVLPCRHSSSLTMQETFLQAVPVARFIRASSHFHSIPGPESMPEKMPELSYKSQITKASWVISLATFKAKILYYYSALPSVTCINNEM